MSTVLKTLTKQLLLLLHPLVFFLYKQSKEHPYLCIITPIFDPALSSLKLLIQDLQNQSYDNFILVCISNGASPKTEKYMNSLNETDTRFRYIALKSEDTSNWKKLLINIGKRRNYGLKHFKAQRYVFIDADSKIVDKNYVAKLALIEKLTKKDIIIYQTRLPDTSLLPFFPINIGRIDITNYTFSYKIARRSRFPENINKHYGIANDVRFFQQINSESNTTFFPFLAIFKNCRSTYKKIYQRYMDETDRIIH